MSVEFIITENINGVGGKGESRISISCGAGYVISETIPGSSTDLPVALVIDVSQLKVIYLKCKTAGLTLEFNSSSSPSKTISLAAGQAFMWHNLNGHANPFGSTDVTGLFVTKAGAGAVLLEGFVGVDPTV